MCGIAGIVDWTGKPALDVVRAMVEALRYRGPDAQNVSVHGAATLGHARLSVIDLSEAANQPMSDASGRLSIVFNGEIYNFKELRAELEALGARFRTHSDTEVMLAAYERWGEECLARFNGMFAFALWDEKRQRLLLARDRLGKKPLFYAETASGIAFASELPALRKHPQVSAEIDPAALRQFLSLGYVLGSDCIARGVLKLPPAHFLSVERGRLSAPRCYWDLAPHFRQKSRWRSEDEALEALDQLFRDAVRLRVVSDVPLGAFLSGGIDSSLIVAAMEDGIVSGPLHTFSAGFRQKSFNEAEQARRVASRLAVHHHDSIIEDGIGNLPALMRHAGEPFADTSLLPTYDLCEFARQRVTVCLSGDGGDELFAGYETYVADRLYRLAASLPALFMTAGKGIVNAALPVTFSKVSLDYKLRQFFAAPANDFRRAHYSWRTIFSPREESELLRPEHRLSESDPFTRFAAFFEQVGDCHYLDQAAYVDIKTWLPDDILVKLDRASMAHGLEARAPFLDYRLAEFAASLPVDLKLRGMRTKYLLKRLHGRYLPASLRPRRKRGFNAPVSHWLNGAGEDAARAWTASAALLEWVDRPAVDRLWAEHRARRRDNGFRLFGLACLGAWLEGAAAGSSVAAQPRPAIAVQ
jgi:asparagine synthase (glutamine-hydrolysing)